MDDLTGARCPICTANALHRLSLTDLFRASFNRPSQAERDMARDLMTIRMVELSRRYTSA